MADATTVHEQVRDYYGHVLETSNDLKTGACACSASMPARHREILGEIHPEIIEKSYGCGSPLPPALDGLTVLDLGCGTGRDVYIASSLVGENGRAIGIDMTDEQLEVARRHADYHAQRFGHARSNVDFRKGYIEDLAPLGVEDQSVDVVISNCVINLSPEKERVFAEILRVLKPGGELYFSDIFADRRIPAPLRDDPVLRGECLGGAMYYEDYRRMLQKLGAPDVRVASSCAVPLEEPEVAEKIGWINFTSVTARVFKLAGLEDRCENYGQAACYLGTIPGHPHAFVLDNGHTFPTGQHLPVCGNTAAMLEDTRFGNHFRVLGDRSTHFGLMEACSTPGGDSEGESCC